MSSPITIAPHLQRALDVMSKDMAVEPQALVNQAVFAWLRINGYVLPGTAPRSEAPAPVVAAPAVEVPVVAPVVAPVRSTPTPVPAAPPPPPPAPVPVPVSVAPVVVPVATPAPAPAPAPVVAESELAPVLARMAEIDADLEKLARPWPAWAPVQAEEEQEEPEAPEEEEEEVAPAASAPEEEEEEPAAAALGGEDDPSLDANTGESEIEAPADSTIVLRSVPIALYLEREGEEPIRVTSDRFIIGRGPHCDLVIDSPRVSREHVALTRSGILFFIEDLNSSNGTWLRRGAGDEARARER